MKKSQRNFKKCQKLQIWSLKSETGNTEQVFRINWAFQQLFDEN